MPIVEGFDAKFRKIAYDLFGRGELIFGKAVSGFHDQRICWTPRCSFGGLSRSQFEVARVEERFSFGFDINLGRSEYMAGWKQANRGIPEIDFGPEGKLMFDSLSWQARCHEPGGVFRKNRFAMICDVITMSVGDKGCLLFIPRIEPNIKFWEENAALEVDLHDSRYVRNAG